MRPALTLVALVLLGGASCAQPDHGPPPLAAATDTAAVAVARALLEAAQARDVKRVDAALCGADGDGRAEAALAGPLRFAGYAIDRAEPAWVGAEPYYRVEVTLTNDTRVERRESLSVRAREGCVDRLLGEPVGGAKRAEGEISL